MRSHGLRPDLTAVPLDGGEPSQVVLATRAGEHNRLVVAFTVCAARLLVRRQAGLSG
ncbi:hypothetical protein ACFC58_13320 [Kitasatospora purpeofusca]|uniref:hypothetical protein n=1 Tax=Kitasatospora purpeofusca TaxID=67352 RepID=UPI0035DF9D74